MKHKIVKIEWHEIEVKLDELSQEGWDVHSFLDRFQEPHSNRV